MVKISVLTPTIRGNEGLKRPLISLRNQTFKDFEWLVEKHNPKDPPDFNAAMNRLVDRAHGELIVFLQDYIKINQYGLARFWAAYEATPSTFFTAPVGKTKDDREVAWDWRKHRLALDGCDFKEWEIDWACAPKSAIIGIGGFDEELDKHWGFDNVNIGMRATMAGHQVKNLPENEAVALDHNFFKPHPYQSLRNPAFHNARLQEIKMGLQIVWTSKTK